MKFVLVLVVFFLCVLTPLAKNIRQQNYSVGEGSALTQDEPSVNNRFDRQNSLTRETGSVRWQKVNSSPVCFGAKNNQFGSFYVPASRLAAIKLVWLYGYVSCDMRHTSNWSHWGCGDKMKAQVNVAITTTANRILLPPRQFLTISTLEWYKIPGYNSLSPELVLSVLSTPQWISSDQELRLWYGEDLVNLSEEDNGGTVCVDVYALFV